MRGRACWAAGLIVVAINCASIRDMESHPHPTKDRPIPMCAISCGRGGRLMFGRQHLCTGGASRYFTDFLATGEHTIRNADGTIAVDDWTSRDGDFAKVTVEIMPCSSYIAQVIAGRDPAQRGQLPGENPDGTKH